MATTPRTGDEDDPPPIRPLPGETRPLSRSPRASHTPPPRSCRSGDASTTTSSSAGGAGATTSSRSPSSSLADSVSGGGLADVEAEAAAEAATAAEDDALMRRLAAAVAVRSLHVSSGAGLVGSGGRGSAAPLEQHNAHLAGAQEDYAAMTAARQALAMLGEHHTAFINPPPPLSLRAALATSGGVASAPPAVAGPTHTYAWEAAATNAVGHGDPAATRELSSPPDALPLFPVGTSAGTLQVSSVEGTGDGDEEEDDDDVEGDEDNSDVDAMQPQQQQQKQLPQQQRAANPVGKGKGRKKHNKKNRARKNKRR